MYTHALTNYKGNVVSGLLYSDMNSSRTESQVGIFLVEVGTVALSYPLNPAVGCPAYCRLPFHLLALCSLGSQFLTRWLTTSD